MNENTGYGLGSIVMLGCLAALMVAGVSAAVQVAHIGVANQGGIPDHAVERHGLSDAQWVDDCIENKGGTIQVWYSGAERGSRYMEVCVDPETYDPAGDENDYGVRVCDSRGCVVTLFKIFQESLDAVEWYCSGSGYICVAETFQALGLKLKEAMR